MTAIYGGELMPRERDKEIFIGSVSVDFRVSRCDAVKDKIGIFAAADGGDATQKIEFTWFVSRGDDPSGRKDQARPAAAVGIMGGCHRHGVTPDACNGPPSWRVSLTFVRFRTAVHKKETGADVSPLGRALNGLPVFATDALRAEAGRAVGGAAGCSSASVPPQ